MSNNFGYALAVEKLMGINPPERAEYLRVMMAELTRIVNHLALFGFLMNDLGAYFTPFLYAFEERELILDIFEAVSGARMMCNYFRFGGVARDLPDGIMEKVKDLVLERLPRKIDDDTYHQQRVVLTGLRCAVLTPGWPLHVQRWDQFESPGNPMTSAEHNPMAFTTVLTSTL
jgi:NADH:ubiquinone oxidoreductase subunit D